MTSPLPRKPRTTAPRTTRLRTAAKLAAAALLCGGPAAAQQPGPPAGQTPVQFGRTLNTPPGGQPPAANSGNPSPGFAAPRPTTAADAVRGVPLPTRLPAPGSAGRVMYFHKPAG